MAVEPASLFRPWPIHRDRKGWIRWYQRFLEAWWIIKGEQSLHRAFQCGMDHGTRNEYARLIYNGAAEGEARAYRERMERTASAGQAQPNPYLNCGNLAAKSDAA